MAPFSDQDPTPEDGAEIRESETAAGDHHLGDGKAVWGATVEWGFWLTAHVQGFVDEGHGRTFVGEAGESRARFGHRTTDRGDSYSQIGLFRCQLMAAFLKPGRIQ